MTPDNSPQIDTTALRDVTAGCGWTLDELVRFYEPRARAELAKIRAALTADDAETLARLAHGAAGSSATVGCTSLASLYRALSESAGSAEAADLGAQVDRVQGHLESTLQRLESLAGGGS